MKQAMAMAEHHPDQLRKRKPKAPTAVKTVTLASLVRAKKSC